MTYALSKKNSTINPALLKNTVKKSDEKIG